MKRAFALSPTCSGPQPRTKESVASSSTFSVSFDLRVSARLFSPEASAVADPRSCSETCATSPSRSRGSCAQGVLATETAHQRPSNYIQHCYGRPRCLCGPGHGGVQLTASGRCFRSRRPSLGAREGGAITDRGHDDWNFLDDFFT